MGAFDDLITTSTTKSAGGAFDDLIQKKRVTASARTSTSKPSKRATKPTAKKSAKKPGLLDTIRAASDRGGKYLGKATRSVAENVLLPIAAFPTQIAANVINPGAGLNEYSLTTPGAENMDARWAAEDAGANAANIVRRAPTWLIGSPQRRETIADLTNKFITLAGTPFTLGDAAAMPRGAVEVLKGTPEAVRSGDIGPQVGIGLMAAGGVHGVRKLTGKGKTKPVAEPVKPAVKPQPEPAPQAAPAERVTVKPNKSGKLAPTHQGEFVIEAETPKTVKLRNVETGKPTVVAKERVVTKTAQPEPVVKLSLTTEPAKTVEPKPVEIDGVDVSAGTTNTEALQRLGESQSRLIRAGQDAEARATYKDNKGTVRVDRFKQKQLKDDLEAAAIADKNQAANDLYMSLDPQTKIGDVVDFQGAPHEIVGAKFDLTQSADAQNSTGFPSTFEFDTLVGKNLKTGELRDLYRPEDARVMRGKTRPVLDELLGRKTEPTLPKKPTTKALSPTPDAAPVKPTRALPQDVVDDPFEAIGKSEPKTSKLDNMEAVIRQRMAERAAQSKPEAFGNKPGQRGASLSVEEFADYAALGAVKIAKGFVKFADWSAEMVREFGDKVKPHLKRLYIDARKRHKNEILPEVDVVAKLTKLIKSAKPALKETQELYGQELSKRAAKVASAQSRYQGQEAFKRGFGEMKGELPKAQFEPPKAGLTELDVFELVERVRTTQAFGAGNKAFTKQNTYAALMKLLDGQIPQRAEIAKLEQVFGPEFAAALLKKRPRLQRLWENIIDVGNIPRTFKTIMDVSAILRQGALLSVGEFPRWANATGKMFKVMFSEKNYKALDDGIRSHKHFDLYDRSGGYTAPINQAASLAAREEAFVSRIVHKIPVLKQVVGVSERAYIGFLNALRTDVFYRYADLWGKNASPDDYSALASFINKATGRGDLGSFEGVAAQLSTVFFSPRYVVSRFQAPLSMLPVFNKSGRVRNVAAKNMMGYFAATTSLLALLDYSGIAEVELDPRSSDFGKAKIGNTRLDFFAGYQQIARYMAQFARGQRKTSDGQIQKVRRSDIGVRFGRSKLAPLPGFAWDVSDGKSFTGEDISFDKKGVKRMAADEFVPMTLQDFWEAAEDEGLLSGILYGGLASTGVGVQTYKDESNGSGAGYGSSYK